MIYIFLGIILVLFLSVISTIGFIINENTEDLSRFFKILFGNITLWSTTLGSCYFVEMLYLTFIN